MARKSTKRPVLKQETGEKYPAAVVGTGAAARTAGGADADARPGAGASAGTPEASGPAAGAQAPGADARGPLAGTDGAPAPADPARSPGGAPRDAYRDELTHVDEKGDVRMVDVGGKAVTARLAAAEGSILMHPETQRMVLEDRARKGDVLACARVAGIMASKRTSELVPMCHPLMLTKSKVDIEPIPASGAGARPDGRVGFHVLATCGVTGVTGIEMEALTAASVACLTIYDMCKAVDRGMEVVDVRLLRKEGGRSGLWQRAETGPDGLAAEGTGGGDAASAEDRVAEEPGSGGGAAAAARAGDVPGAPAACAADGADVGAAPADRRGPGDAPRAAEPDTDPGVGCAASSPLPGGPGSGTPAPAIAFIGYQNSGKTTLVEKIISRLTQRGLRVGSIKHHGHKGFDIDQPGKDSWRHAQAGSRHVGLIAPGRYAEYADTTSEEVPVRDLLTHYTDVDVVIVEGYKTAGLPNIVVTRSGVDRLRGDTSYDLIDGNTLAVACNDIVERDFRRRAAKAAREDGEAAELPPFLSINDAAAIVNFILRWLGR